MASLRLVPGAVCVRPDGSAFSPDSEQIVDTSQLALYHGPFGPVMMVVANSEVFYVDVVTLLNSYSSHEDRLAAEAALGSGLSVIQEIPLSVGGFLADLFF